MAIYTKTGDLGETGLLDCRVPKDSARVEAYGTIDELNSSIGVARSFAKDKRAGPILLKVQKELFLVCSELASKKVVKSSITPDMTLWVEKSIDELCVELGPLKGFVVPGGSKGAAMLHLSRTICRRAERRVVSLNREERVSEHILTYLNRLSTLLFVLALIENKNYTL